MNQFDLFQDTEISFLDKGWQGYSREFLEIFRWLETKAIFLYIFVKYFLILFQYLNFVRIETILNTKL